MSTYVELRATIADFSAKMNLAVEEFGMLEKAQAEAAAAMEASGAALGAAVGREAEAVTAASVEMGAALQRSAFAYEKVAISAETAAIQNKLANEKMAADTAAMSAKMELLRVKSIESNEAIATAGIASADKVDAAAKKSAKAYGMAALALVAVGAESVHLAANFETSTNKLVTSAGETEANIGMVRDGLLKMSGEVGVSAIHLSDAMYKIESAGYHAGAGLGMLKAAEQGAKAEGADATKVADALSSAMRDYYPHAQSAADVTRLSADTMSKLIGATAAGKMTFDDLAGSLNSVLPVASAANISLTDTLGVLASMTVHGISAEQATQNMADAIRHLQAATPAMTKAMATMGIDSQDVSAKLGERGLSGTMQMLSEKVRSFMPPGSDKVILDLGDALSKSTPKVQELGQKLMDGTLSQKEYTKAAWALDPINTKQALSFGTLAGSTHLIGNEMLSGADVMKTYGGQLQAVMGDATGLKVALMTTGENAEYTKGAINDISHATADAGGNVKGWHEIQGTFNQKMSEAKGALQATAIAIGTNLLPPLTALVGWVADAARWFSENKVAADALGIAIGVLASGAIVGMIGKLASLGGGLVKNLISPITGSIGFIRNFAGAVEDTAGGKLAGFVGKLGGVGSAVRGFAVALAEGAVSMARMGAAAAATTARLVVQGAVWVAQKVAMIAAAVAEAALTAAQWLLNIAMDANPIGIIILAIGVLIGVVILLVRNWQFVSDFFRELWADVTKIFKIAIDWVVDVIKGWYPLILGIMSGGILLIPALIFKYWSQISGWFQGIWNNVQGGFRWLGDRANDFGNALGSAFGWVMDRARDLWNFVKPILDGIGNAIGKVVSMAQGVGNAVGGVISGVGHLLGFAEGGWVPGSLGEARLAVVHGGEYVLSNEMLTGRVAPDEGIASSVGDIGRQAGGGAGAGVVGVPQRGQGGNVFITVMGTVTAERDLVAQVRQSTLRYNMQNSGNGLSLAGH